MKKKVASTRHGDRNLRKRATKSASTKSMATLINQEGKNSMNFQRMIVERANKNYCVHCRKMFISAEALKTHNIEAHYISQLKNRWIPNTQYCNICEKYFSSFQTMKNHYKTIHLNIKQNQHCNLCPKKFSTEKALEFHKNFIHPMKNVPKMRLRT